jgi:hypothetical protein
MPRANLTGLIILVVAVPAFAQDMPALPAPAVSLSVRDVPLRQALRPLASGGKVVITVDRNVPDVPVRLTLRDVTVEHALRLLVRQASREVPLLELSSDNGFRLYLRTPDVKTSEQLSRANPNRITGKFKNTPTDADGEAKPDFEETGKPAMKPMKPNAPPTREPNAKELTTGDEGEMQGSAVPEGGLLPSGAGFVPNENPLPDVGIPGTYIIPKAPSPRLVDPVNERPVFPRTKGSLRQGYRVLPRKRGRSSVGGTLRGFMVRPPQNPVYPHPPQRGKTGKPGESPKGGFGVRPL